MSTTIPASLFLPSTAQRSVDAIPFDLILQEDHAFESQVTQYSVETGGVVSDHVVCRPRKGKLQGLVSNFSLQHTNKLDRELENLFRIGRPGRWKAGPVSVPNRALTTWELFRELWQKRLPVTVATTLEVYESVVVTNVATTRDGDSGDALKFAVDFEEVKVVQLEEVVLQADIKPTGPMKSKGEREAANRQASPNADAGAQTGTEMVLDEVAV